MRELIEKDEVLIKGWAWAEIGRTGDDPDEPLEDRTI
jgi:hypothetical protein